MKLPTASASQADRSTARRDLVLPHGYPQVEISASAQIAADHWCSADLGLTEADEVVCFFGTIGRFFEINIVIDAARRLASSHPTVKFVLCGDGSGRDGYLDAAHGLDNVVLPGWVDQAQIRALMSRSKIGLAPYRGGTTMSLPNKPFEYMSAGLPVVTSIDGEIGQLLSKHNCGIVYRAGDPVSLAATISALIDTPGDRAEMGRRALELFEANYTSEHLSRTLDQHLRAIMTRQL